MKIKLEYKCSCCNKIKDKAGFYKSSKAKNGLANRCKVCDLSYQRGRKEEKSVANSKWYIANKDKFLSALRVKTKEKRASIYKEVLKEVSLDRWRIDRAKRSLAISLSTPHWARNRKHVAHKNEIYSITQKLQEVTGCIYHVDHIVPLQSKCVCGLNVWWNLQPMSEKSNIVKNNIFEPRLYPEQGEVAFPSGDGLNVAQLRYAQRMETDADE